MTMHRMAALLLVLALCLTVFTASAETTVNDQSFKWNYADLNTTTGTLMVKTDRNSGYRLMDANGNLLNNAVYNEVRANGIFYRVSLVEGTNTFGVVDAAGNQVLPFNYGDVKFISNEWLAGVVLEAATEDNYDYTTYGTNKQFFKVARYDMYFMGQLVGSLGRTDYDYATTHGKYLWVRAKSGSYTAYDPQFNSRPVEYSSEWNYDYKTKSVTHNATGMKAFCADCTLTADDVEVAQYEIDGVYYDLQGNVLFQDDHYTVYSYYGDYAKTRNKAGAYGIIDTHGNVMLPEQYDNIDLANSSIGYYPCGYQLVVKDSKLGLAKLNGDVWMSNYPSGAKYNNYGPFVFINDLDGSRIVLSGAIGEMNEHYADIRSSYDSTAPIFVAQNRAGEIGIVGLMGEAVIPFSTEHTNLYDYDMSKDGTVILVRDNDYKDGQYTYHVILVDYDFAAANPVTVDVPTAPAADGSWTCPNCSNINTGKFCPECGTPKPVTDWTCPGCGSINSGKFCPECGTPRP